MSRNRHEDRAARLTGEGLTAYATLLSSRMLDTSHHVRYLECDRVTPTDELEVSTSMDMSWSHQPLTRRRTLAAATGLAAGALLPPWARPRGRDPVHEPGDLAGLRGHRHHARRRHLLRLGIDDALLARRARSAVVRPGELGDRRPCGTRPRLRRQVRPERRPRLCQGNLGIVTGLPAQQQDLLLARPDRLRPDVPLHRHRGGGAVEQADDDQHPLLRRRPARRHRRHPSTWRTATPPSAWPSSRPTAATRSVRRRCSGHRPASAPWRAPASTRSTGSTTSS